MKETMSLIGGIDTYAFTFNKRYESDISPMGRKVAFLDKNGYDIEQEHAREFFSKGDTLTVKEIYVGRSSSTVEFDECPNKQFNTVMFADAIK